MIIGLTPLAPSRRDTRPGSAPPPWRTRRTPRWSRSPRPRRTRASTRADTCSPDTGTRPGTGTREVINRDADTHIAAGGEAAAGRLARVGEGEVVGGADWREHGGADAGGGAGGGGAHVSCSSEVARADTCVRPPENMQTVST